MNTELRSENSFNFTNSSNSFLKILLVFPNNLRNVCINSTLSIRVEFMHVCVKFMQFLVEFMQFQFLIKVLVEIVSFFSVISCVRQIERISFISCKTFPRKG